MGYFRLIYGKVNCCDEKINLVPDIKRSRLYWLSTSHDREKFGTRALQDDVIKWKHFPRYWPFVRGIHRSPVNSPYEGQWRRALMFSLICSWTNSWVNNHEAGDLRGHQAHYDVSVMGLHPLIKWCAVHCFSSVHCTQCIVQIYIMAGHAIVVVKDINLLFCHGNAVILTLW